MMDMTEVRRFAAKVAQSPINVLILGECGVGKDVLARDIHQRSARAGKPFMEINCAAIPESLMTAELFGHEKGAFTGAAVGGRIGLLEAGDGGTVFLDEIGDMPLSMQATLLRVIETREVRPIGSVRSRLIDVRFIAATNKDLDAMVNDGTFRRDLLHRINTMTLAVPPLRERVEEIEALTQRFVADAWKRMGTGSPPTISPEASAWLLQQDWPGNIRELKNVMERAVALTDGPEILLEHLPVRHDPGPASVPELLRDDLDAARRRDRQRILDALAACYGNQTRAAALLGIPRRTFVAKLDQYRVPRPQKSIAGSRAAISGETLARSRQPRSSGLGSAGA
jgi:transcriptional regulator with PAS, ATPase and Fis domain